MGDPRALRTVYLGQFEHVHAEQVAERLEGAGIAWTHKQFGRLARWLFAEDWGVRMFVEAGRAEEARSIVERLKTTDDWHKERS